MNTPDEPQPGSPPAQEQGKSSRILVNHALQAAVAAIAAAAALGLYAWVTGLFDEGPPGCPGKGCEGRNPQKYAACTADALSFLSPGDNPATLEIRYSKTCGAVWGRITTGEVGDRVTVKVADGGVRSAVIAVHHDVFTPMAAVGSEFTVDACVEPSKSTERTGTWTKYCMEASDTVAWAEDTGR